MILTLLEGEMVKTPESLQKFSKSLMDLDMTKGVEQVLNQLAELKVPGVDMDALVASQRDNLEAVAKANRAAMEGLKGVGEWQVKILKQAMEDISESTAALTRAESPQAALVEQAEVAKRVFEMAVKNMQDLADILHKANEDATKVIVERVPESLDEIKEVLKTKK
jgi:phasin family protein